MTSSTRSSPTSSPAAIVRRTWAPSLVWFWTGQQPALGALPAALRTHDHVLAHRHTSSHVGRIGRTFRARPTTIKAMSRRAYIASPTYFTSRYSSSPSRPPSRPKPEALTPPNGAAGLEMTPALSPTRPDSRPSATVRARRRSLVYA